MPKVTRGYALNQPNQHYSPTHGRTTNSQHHADLQVLKRIRQFLLPSEFQVSADLLQQLQTGYDIADNPVDSLLAQQIKFAKPLQKLILAEQGFEPPRLYRRRIIVSQAT